LARALADMNESRSLPLTLVAGMMAGKAAKAYFEKFRGIAQKVLTVPIPNQEGGMKARELADIAREAGLEARPVRGIASALAAIKGGPQRVAICGSLYLAGHALALSKTPPE
jgi:dihydrofolate synthase/folylpolyglutamate synthase